MAGRVNKRVQGLELACNFSCLKDVTYLIPSFYSKADLMNSSAAVNNDDDELDLGCSRLTAAEDKENRVPVLDVPHDYDDGDFSDGRGVTPEPDHSLQLCTSTPFDAAKAKKLSAASATKSSGRKQRLALFKRPYIIG